MENNPLPRREQICEVCGMEGIKSRYCHACAVEASRENMAQVALIGHSRPKTQRAKQRISGSERESVRTRILRGFLQSDEFGLGGRQALCL
jgi:hypothetical protein